MDAVARTPMTTSTSLNRAAVHCGRGDAFRSPHADKVEALHEALSCEVRHPRLEMPEISAPAHRPAPIAFEHRGIGVYR